MRPSRAAESCSLISCAHAASYCSSSSVWDSASRLLPAGSLCSQNVNQRSFSMWCLICFLLCVCFQCVTGSGQRWRETSWWRSTIPSSSSCTTVSHHTANQSWQNFSDLILIHFPSFLQPFRRRGSSIWSWIFSEEEISSLASPRR